MEILTEKENCDKNCNIKAEFSKGDERSEKLVLCPRGCGNYYSKAIKKMEVWDKRVFALG